VGVRPELLDIDVDELATPAALIAADRSGGLAIEVAETVQVVADQHPIDRRGRQLELDREPVGTHSFGSPLPADLRFHVFGEPPRRPPRAAGTVMQPVEADLEIAVPPLRCATTGDTHRRREVCDRCAGLDPATQQESTLRGQRGVTVTHEDLREVVLAWTPAHLLPEVCTLVDPRRVTNVCDGNS
jgi:hypothetical protein